MYFSAQWEWDEWKRAASVGNLGVVRSGVRSGKRRLLLGKEVENEAPAVWCVWKNNEERTNSWITNVWINEIKQS